MISLRSYYKMSQETKQFVCRDIVPEDADLLLKIDDASYYNDIEGHDYNGATTEEDRNDIRRRIESVDPRFGQRSFLIYDGEDPAGYMELEGGEVDGDYIMHEIVRFATIPKYRSVSLLTATIERLRDTQHPDYRYGYTAAAEPDTSFKGLKKPGVRNWLRRQGIEYMYESDAEEFANAGFAIFIDFEFKK